jgi:hypothetical protein
MYKRKNRPHPHAVKRRCVESHTSWFAFMTFILVATMALWVYITISIFKFV